MKHNMFIEEWNKNYKIRKEPEMNKNIFNNICDNTYFLSKKQ